MTTSKVSLERSFAELQNGHGFCYVFLIAWMGNTNKQVVRFLSKFVCADEMSLVSFKKVYCTSCCEKQITHAMNVPILTLCEFLSRLVCRLVCQSVGSSLVFITTPAQRPPNTQFGAKTIDCQTNEKH